MAPSSRLDAFQQRHPSVGFPIAVFYKYFDDEGSYLAALITYYAFVSLFPVLLLLTTLLGVLLRNNAHLRDQLLNSAFQQFPVVGKQLGEPKALQGSTLGLSLALLTSLYGALGVAQAVQNAMNVAWAVPKNKRPNPVLARLRSLLLLATSGLMLVATTAVSAVSNQGLLGRGTAQTVLFLLVSALLNVGVLVLALRLATALPLTLREVLPGAVLGGVVWTALQTLGAVYVKHVLRNASDTNATFGVVLGLIAWIFLLATTLVLCVEINVVRARRLHPRSLLTPFTDDVDLTSADRRAYTQYARAQRNKGFETVDVNFEHDGQYATAKRRWLRRAVAEGKAAADGRAVADGADGAATAPSDEPATERS